MKISGRRPWGWLAAAVLAISASAGLWFQTASLAQEEEETRRPASSRSSVKQQVSSADIARLEKRLNEVLANQKTMLENQQAILQKFDAVMEELRIIKVRATLAGSRGS